MAEEEESKFKLRKWVNGYGWEINSDSIDELVELNQELEKKFPSPKK